MWDIRAEIIQIEMYSCVLRMKYSTITEFDNNSSGENTSKPWYIFTLTFIWREIIEHKSLYLVQ